MNEQMNEQTKLLNSNDLPTNKVTDYSAND